jgi:hypothetical protein
VRGEIDGRVAVVAPEAAAIADTNARDHARYVTYPAGNREPEASGQGSATPS